MIEPVRQHHALVKILLRFFIVGGDPAIDAFEAFEQGCFDAGGIPGFVGCCGGAAMDCIFNSGIGLAGLFVCRVTAGGERGDGDIVQQGFYCDGYVATI